MAKYRLKAGCVTATLPGRITVRAGEVVEGEFYAAYPQFFDVVEADPVPSPSDSDPTVLHEFYATR